MEIVKQSDLELIEMIRLGGENRKYALRYIFKNWNDDARRIVRSKGYDIELVKDAVQEAVITLDDKIRNDEFTFMGEGKLRTYFISMVDKRAYSMNRSNWRNESTDEDYKLDGVESANPESIIVETEFKNTVQQVLNALGEKCKQVLSLFKQNYSYDEIAELANLKNKNNARQKALQCRTKMKEYILSNPELVTVFNQFIKNK